MTPKKFYAPVAEKTHDLDSEPVALPVRRRILLVDDDVVLQELTRLILEQNGYEVDGAPDGVQGIKKILANEYLAVICDMVMPNLAGDMFYLAVQRVKPELCKRFIFMTGHNGDRKIDEFIRKVRGLMLWKPVESHVLLEALQTIEKKCGQV